MKIIKMSLFLMLTIGTTRSNTEQYSYEEDTKFFATPLFLFSSEPEVQEFFMKKETSQKLIGIGAVGLVMMWIHRKNKMKILPRPLLKCLESIFGIVTISGFATWLWQHYNQPDPELPQPYDFSEPCN